MAGSSFCLGVHLLQTSIAWLRTHLPRVSAARDIDWLAFFIGATTNGNAIRRVPLEAFIATPPVAQISGDLSTTKRE
jgi:uncharacterized membrane protein YidH (DUF202 family)